MTVQNIIKKTIKRLELEGKLQTPDLYAEAFCKEATKAGVKLDDCTHTDTYTKMLNKEFQDELSDYRIKTMNELVRFLISRLNRTNPSTCNELLEEQILFIKRILQVVDMLHNKEASALAKKSLELINVGASSSQIEQFRRQWINFITVYDESFLLKLKALGDVDTSDLKKSIENLNIPMTHIDEKLSSVELKNVASALAASLVPSIASSVNDEIAALSEKIRKDPSILGGSDIEREIRSAISLRISLDKETLKEMVESLDGVLDKLSLRLIDMIERSDNSTVEIQKIKDELEEYNEYTSDNFKVAHKKLFTIASALEENTKVLSQDLKDDSSEVSRLTQRVAELEKELSEVREESKEDFLTKVFNKRALDEFLNIKEAEYNRYGHNYTVIMLDMDHFKSINDTYGHDAGDAVLSVFAKILKTEARNVDIVGRFGGEEFMAILSETDVKGGVVFAEKVRKHVERAKFMYKKERIEVTVSCGVAERKTHTSLSTTVKASDEFLYKAKRSGRNLVAYK